LRRVGGWVPIPVPFQTPGTYSARHGSPMGHKSVTCTHTRARGYGTHDVQVWVPTGSTMSTGSIVSLGSVVTVWYLWVQWYLLVHGQWVHIISLLKDIYCMYRSNTYVYLLVRWRARGPRGHGKCKGPMCAHARVWPKCPRIWSEGGGVIVARIPSHLERESGVVGENILTFGVREEWVWVWVWAAWPCGCE
jgi:hypothetical protein